MGKISVFDYVSIDGFFAGPEGEIDWFKDIKRDHAYDKYTRGQSQSKSTLMFGRKTYEMMKSFWPTTAAREMQPQMAAVMNESPKIVFSKSLKKEKDQPHWKNIQVIKNISKGVIKKLKEENKNGLTILGSGTLVQQLTDLGLIDHYTLVMVPVVLGNGKPLFEGVTRKDMKLVESKSFGNGIVVQHYEL